MLKSNLLETANQKRLEGQFQEAIELQSQALALDPDDAHAHVNLGVMHMGMARYDAAARSFSQALVIHPDFKEALYNLGIALRMQGDHLTAVHCNQRVIELEPTFIGAYDNLCDSLIALKNFSAVAKYAMQVIALDGHHANGYYHLGIACHEQGNLQGSVTFLERAIALNPHNANMRNALSLVKLALGELDQGWQDYEFRWLKETQPVKRLQYSIPCWMGEPGKTVLIWGEQGIADQIMFASMMEDAIARCAKVILACSQKLIPLFQRSFPKADVVHLEDKTTLPSDCLQSAIGSIARWLRPDVASFPRCDHYLVADSKRVAYWKKRLVKMGAELTVGICWRSSDLSGDRYFYCSKIEQWQSVFAVPGVRFINLQYDECGAELALVQQRFGVTVHNFPEVDLYNDLDETAALTKSLDLVIAAPTTAGILAAALGVPTWQMVSGFSWQKFGTQENCWYGSLTTFNRPWDKSWEQLLAEVAIKLNNRAGLQRVGQSDAQWVAASIKRAFHYHQLGLFNEAQEIYQTILQKQPDHAEAIHYLGVSSYQQKKFECAEELIRRSIAREPAVAKYYCNYGLLLLEQGRYKEVIETQNKAIQLLPHYAEPYLNLSTALFKLGRYVESAHNARLAIKFHPANVKAYDNLGSALRFLYDYSASISSYERAIQLDPTYVAAYTNLAATYLEIKNLEAVSVYCMKAIELDAGHVYGYLYLGLACREQGDLEQAESFISHAANLASQDYLIQWNLSLNMLAMGKLESGWKNYESRWHLEDILPVRMQHFPYPWWQGEAMLDKTILIWGEQGIGDQIMFASMLEDVMSYFKQCVIACPQKLMTLLARSFPAAQIVCQDDTQGMAELSKVIDVQSAIGSLARWLRPTVSSFTKKNHYLKPDPDRVIYWKNRLAALGPGPKIGICWRSGNTAGSRQYYCSRIEQWASLFAVPGVHFINLQYDECAAELEKAHQMFGVTVHAFPEVDLFDDLDESAALTKALDLVIGIPTTSVILAAAMGMPSFMLFSGFNWQKFGTSDNCWYSSAQQMQRRWDQSWDVFLDEITHELALKIAEIPH